MLWAVLAEVQVPFSSLRVPSLLMLARGVVPGLDAVRVELAVASGFYLVCALRAGFGVRALVGGSRPGMGHVVTALLVAAAMLETFHPRLAVVTFGRAVEFGPRLKRPPDDHARACRDGTIHPGKLSSRTHRCRGLRSSARDAGRPREAGDTGRCRRRHRRARGPPMKMG